MEKSGRNGVSKDLWVPKLNLYFAGAQFPRNSWVDHVFHVNEKWFLRWEKWKRKGMVSELTSRKRERKGKERKGKRRSFAYRWTINTEEGSLSPTRCRASGRSTSRSIERTQANIPIIRLIHIAPIIRFAVTLLYRRPDVAPFNIYTAITV